MAINFAIINFNAPTRPSFLLRECVTPLLSEYLSSMCLLPADTDQRHVYVPDVQFGLLVGSVYWAPLELRPSLPDVLSTDMEPDVSLIAHLQVVLGSILGFY